MPWTFHLRTTYGSMTEAERLAEVESPASPGQRAEAEHAAPDPMQAGDETAHHETS
jgi:hypothetical protein